MCKMFETWRHEIRRYCETNHLSFAKAERMAKAWGRDDLILQYHDPQKGRYGLRDETPAPVVLIMRIQNGKPVFEQTQHTRKYLT